MGLYPFWLIVTMLDEYFMIMGTEKWLRITGIGNLSHKATMLTLLCCSNRSPTPHVGKNLITYENIFNRDQSFISHDKLTFCDTTVLCLLCVTRSPRTVHHDHHLGCRQVDPDPARADGGHQHFAFFRLKTVNHGLPSCASDFAGQAISV